MRRDWKWMAVAIVTAEAINGGALAAPYTPADDALVLERLPEALDPALAELKRMRAGAPGQSERSRPRGSPCAALHRSGT
jgi:hypothetical protein